jgi:lipid-A-disaccharide synthase
MGPVDMVMHVGPTPSVMLSAGEASGDLHGGALCRALTDMWPGLRLSGMGGARMAAAGLEVIADPTSRAVVGVSEALGRVPGLYRAYRSLVNRLRDERPQALVVIDFPDFNLRLARQARRAGVPVVYFIPPQLWAWRRGRVRQMRRRVSRVLAVLPFEQELYEGAGVPVDFVGHPLLDVLPLDLGREEARRRLGLCPGEAVVALLPGSRREEVARLLPAMLTAAARLASAGAARRVVLALAPTISRAAVQAFLGSHEAAGGPRVDVLEGLTYEAMAGADVILVASGTATLEAALLGTPMVVCYRVSRFTEAMVRLLVRVPWASLPNIVAGRPVVPEVLQDEVSGERLAAEALRLLDDPLAATAQRAAFKEVRARLGEPGVARRAAAAVIETVARSRIGSAP